jgi:hypothetical protein
VHRWAAVAEIFIVRASPFDRRAVDLVSCLHGWGR